MGHSGSLPHKPCRRSFGRLEEAIVALRFSDVDDLVAWAATASPQELESVAGTLASLLME